MDYLSVGFFDRSQICNVMHGTDVVRATKQSGKSSATNSREALIVLRVKRAG
jgi:hypothetical protein